MSGIVLGNLELDRDRFKVRVDGFPVQLSFIQFELLYQLATKADRLVEQKELLRAIWGNHEAGDARKLRIHVSRLRKKIAGSRPWRIQTVTKRGYALMNAEAEIRLPAHVLVHTPAFGAARDARLP